MRMDFDIAYENARAEMTRVYRADETLAFVLLNLRIAALTIDAPRDDIERGKLAAYRAVLDTMTGYDGADIWRLVASVLRNYDLSRTAKPIGRVKDSNAA